MQFVNKVPHVSEALFLICDAPDSANTTAAHRMYATDAVLMKTACSLLNLLFKGSEKLKTQEEHGKWA